MAGKKKAGEQQKKTLVEVIVEKNDRSAKGQWGLLKGNKTIKEIADLSRQVGVQELISQAKELEERGLVTVHWGDGKSVIREKGITYSMDQMDEFYRLAGREHPKYQLWKGKQEMEQMVERELEHCRKGWIRRYYESLLAQVQDAVEKSLPKQVCEEYFACLRMLDVLEEPVYKRIFSAACLEDSKAFENKYEDWLVSAAREFCETADDGMEDTQVLEQIGLKEYASQMYLKGPLALELHGENLHVENYRYGVVLNTQTMREVRILPDQSFQNIVTIENKANFETASFREDTLYLFVHGFPGPEERRFLIRLREALENEKKAENHPGKIQYYHSSDLDYGGIRIFRYLRERIFPEVQPYRMDKETYEHYRKLGYGYDLPESIVKKLERIEEPLLEELIECLRREKKGIEQECFLTEPLLKAQMADVSGRAGKQAGS